MSEPYEEYAADWEALEECYFEARQARADKLRVRGYGLACCKLADKTSLEVERAEARVRIAQESLVLAMREANAAYEQVELVARCLSSDDETWIGEVAQRLEEAFG